MKILLSPDPVENPAPGTPASPAAPQAAETVVKGTKTEREVALEKENARLQDEVHQYKNPPTPKNPQPAAPAEKEEYAAGWACEGEEE